MTIDPTISARNPLASGHNTPPRRANSRASAELAEKRAIQKERPRWNVVHSAKTGPLPSQPTVNPCECSNCGRHIGKTRTHLIYNNLVWCLRCSDAHLISGGMFASCAAARQILAGKDLPREVR